MAPSPDEDDASLEIDLPGVFQQEAPPSTVAAARVDPLLPRHLFQAPDLEAEGVRPRPPAPAPVPAPARRSHRERDPELPRVGTIMDRYRLEELLGTGGFAAVYRATHLLLHSQVAIKLLRPSVLRRRPALAELLFAEARFGAAINHPNVARIYDAIHVGDLVYLVMELVEGVTLAHAITARGKLPFDLVLRVGVDVTLGLRAGFDQGLIHRDIKPANVVIARTGEAKIVDLGLAQPFGAWAEEDLLQGRLALAGTFGYMAPEQARDPRSVDFRADIYSLGVTLYEAFVGCPPFPTDDRERCVRMHERDPVPPPDQVVPGFPRAVSELLSSMLSKTASERPSSYGVLIERLRAAQRLLAGTREH